MRRTVFVLIGFLALAGLIGFTVTRVGLGGGANQSAGGGAAFGATGASAGAFAATGATGAEEAIGGAAAAPQPARDAATSALPALPDLGSSVIRTAQIGIEVKKGAFGAAFDAASLVAGRYGGYVQSSSMAGTKSRTGDLLIRVPADRFDAAMSDLRGLGTVERQSMSGEDVSAQFVDLDARLRTWQAQEAVLLDLMGRATSIEATIRVQGELQDVQLRIEQIKGQLNLLQDRTDFATIQVSLREAGAPVELQQAKTSRPSLVDAWDRALDGFLGVLYAVVVGLGYLVPIALLAGLGWLGYRRVRTAGPAAPPAS